MNENESGPSENENISQSPQIPDKVQDAIELLLKSDDFLLVTFEADEKDENKYKTCGVVSRPIAIGSLVEVARQMMIDTFIPLPDMSSPDDNDSGE